MPLQVGQTLLNKYRIERMLGEGGFGYVYEATDLTLQRRVAIKELKAELASQPEAFNRFVNEAVAIANLRNPYIVTMLNREQDGNHHYMIMEYMDGGSLGGLLAKRRILSPGEAAKIAKAVCDGLTTAHRAGIVHRDIKSANILMSRDGQTVKVSDFGIAHVPSAITGQANLTRTGTAMGTPWYMSPEQARGERVDARSDLYAVGVMLYEMLAGYMYLDFTSDFFGDLEKLTTTPPRPLPPNVPQGLQQIIAKALTKDPAQRFQSAEEMSAALQAFITPGATITVPRTPMSSRVRPTAPAQRTNPLLIAGAAAIIVLVLLLVGLIVIRLSTQQPAQVAAIGNASVTPVPQATLSPTADVQMLVAQSMLATQTAQKAADSALAAQVAASLTASAPTVTRTPTPTLPPTATPTQTPTATPTPTLTPIPAFTFTGFRPDPANPHPGDGIVFVAIFNNTLGSVRQIKWRVEIMDLDAGNPSWNKLYFVTKALYSDVQPGSQEVRSDPPWSISKNAGIRRFMVRFVELDANNQIMSIFKTPSGQVDFPLTLAP